MNKINRTIAAAALSTLGAFGMAASAANAGGTTKVDSFFKTRVGPEFTMVVTRDTSRGKVQERVAIDVDGKFANIGSDYIMTESYVAQINPENYDTPEARRILEQMSARDRRRVQQARTSKSISKNDVDWMSSHVLTHGRTPNEVEALKGLSKLFIQPKASISPQELQNIKVLGKQVGFNLVID